MHVHITNYIPRLVDAPSHNGITYTVGNGEPWWNAFAETWASSQPFVSRKRLPPELSENKSCTAGCISDEKNLNRNGINDDWRRMDIFSYGCGIFAENWKFFNIVCRWTGVGFRDAAILRILIDNVRMYCSVDKLCYILL